MKMNNDINLEYKCPVCDVKLSSNTYSCLFCDFDFNYDSKESNDKFLYLVKQVQKYGKVLHIPEH